MNFGSINIFHNGQNCLKYHLLILRFCTITESYTDDVVVFLLLKHLTF